MSACEDQLGSSSSSSPTPLQFRFVLYLFGSARVDPGAVASSSTVYLRGVSLFLKVHDTSLGNAIFRRLTSIRTKCGVISLWTKVGRKSPYILAYLAIRASYLILSWDRGSASRMPVATLDFLGLV